MAKIIVGEQYVDEVCDDADLRGADLSECVFTHCSFIRANLTDSMCNAAVFVDCSFEQATLSGTNLFDVRFTRCKLSGIDFSNKTKVVATQFEKCLLDFANFTAVDLSNVKFATCSCIETNFSKACLEKTIFESCLIQDALFRGAHFGQTDFHTSTLSGISIYDEKMRGVILSSQQFLALAREVGITII